MIKSNSSPVLSNLHNANGPKLNKSKSFTNFSNLPKHKHTSSLNAFVDNVDPYILFYTPIPNMAQCSIDQIENYIEYKNDKKDKNEEIKNLAFCLATPPEIKDEEHEKNEENPSTLSLRTNNCRKRRKSQIQNVSI